MLGLDVVERLADGVDRARWNASRFQLLKPQSCRALANGLTHEGYDFRAMRDACSVGRKPFVRGPLRMRAYLGKASELPIVPDGDDDRLIGGNERLVRNDVGVRIALTRRVLAGNQCIRRLVREHG